MGPARTTSPGADSDARASFEAEALEYVDSLYRTALRLTRVPADADDLVQDTYLKAFRAADSFEPGTNLRAWLFTILHNTARNRARDRARETVAIDSDAVDQAAETPQFGVSGKLDDPETLLIRSTLAPELQAAVDELPAAFREAVWLRDVEEFFVRRNRADAQHPSRNGDVAHLARTTYAVRPSPTPETRQCLSVPASILS
ncbi:MAG: sigma-70 family RNA polymerase sigma factor [Vicinamibacterales bacterium]